MKQVWKKAPSWQQPERTGLPEAVVRKAVLGENQAYLVKTSALAAGDPCYLLGVRPLGWR